MKKRIIIIICAVLVCIVGICAALWAILDANAFYAKKFPAGTEINGVDCGKMTMKEAEAALVGEWNSREFKFKKNDSVIGSIPVTDLTYDIEDSLKEVRKDNFFATAKNYFFKEKLVLTMDMPVKETGPAFESALASAEFLKAKKPVTTQDAYIDITKADLPIVEEVQGNDINYKKLSKKVRKLIAQDKFKMDFKGKEFYNEPTITKDDENLKERQDVYKKYLVSKVTYTMGEDKLKIAPADLAKIREVEIAQIGKISEDEIKALKKAYESNHINETAVEEYAQAFAERYNTLGTERNFTSLSGNTFTVKGGDYGYALDVDDEAEQLLADLQSNEKVTREPVWNIEGFIPYNLNGDDIGNTYVEISIGQQRLWYIKDGAILVECPVVTGNPYMGYSTPTGTFSLTYKARGAVLKGNNADGSTYESPVSYWMPFYGNYGMHDAPWRGSFGGRIYRGNGSHGCVNMPVWAARQVFNNTADSNVPILIH